MEDEGTRPNDVRSIGLFFGPSVARRFLRKEDLGLIVRSHEQVQAGVHWPFGAGRDLVTVFSASNYSGKMQNHGAFALLGSTSDAAAAAAAARGTAASVAAEEASASEAAARQLQTDTPPTPMWTVRPGTPTSSFSSARSVPLHPFPSARSALCTRARVAPHCSLFPLLRLWTSPPPSPEQVTGDADKEPTVSHIAPSAPSYSASVSMLSSTSSTSFSAMDEQPDGPQADLPSAPGFASTSSFHPHPQPQPHACLPLPPRPNPTTHPPSSPASPGRPRRGAARWLLWLCLWSASLRALRGTAAL